MSEEGNRDDTTVTLQYLILRTNLLSNLNELTMEHTSIIPFLNNINVLPTSVLDRILNLIADKKSYLLDIAKQGLTSEDYAHFKDLVENFIISYQDFIGPNKKTKIF